MVTMSDSFTINKILKALRAVIPERLLNLSIRLSPTIRSKLCGKHLGSCLLAREFGEARLTAMKQANTESE
jgi:hypothetical protein